MTAQETQKQAIETLISIARQSSGNQDYHKRLNQIYGDALSVFEKEVEKKEDKDGDQN